MGTDPKPNDIFLIDDAKCPIIDIDPYRINWLVSVDLLELKAWVLWIMSK